MVDVSVIIVNWNTKALLKECLASVYAEVCPFALDVIVIDNGSDDGSVEMVRDHFPQVRLIINQTNDTWFGTSAENIQHLSAASVRAIEFRIPIIRSTNSGISAYINTAGEIIDPTRQGAEDTRIYSIRVPERSASLFSIWGPWPLYLYISLLLGAMITAFIVNRKESV